MVVEELDTTSGPRTAVFLVPFHRAETSLAGSLQQLLSGRQDRMPTFANTDWPAAFGWLRARTGTDLAQRDAVRLALTSKVAVLTGGPRLRQELHRRRDRRALARAKKAKIQLVAPTGRAAKRLTELAGQPAATIHRLLALRPGWGRRLLHQRLDDAAPQPALHRHHPRQTTCRPRRLPPRPHRRRPHHQPNPVHHPRRSAQLNSGRNRAAVAGEHEHRRNQIPPFSPEQRPQHDHLHRAADPLLRATAPLQIPALPGFRGQLEVETRPLHHAAGRDRQERRQTGG